MLLGRAGLDYLIARDEMTDSRLDCGPGPDAREYAEVDPKDPAPHSC